MNGSGSGSRGKGLGLGTSSLASRLEQNDTYEFMNEPGPGHYYGPDSAGFSGFRSNKDPTILSKSSSAPEISFAKTGWDRWERVAISKGHEKSMGGKDSPGTLHELPRALSNISAKFASRDFVRKGSTSHATSGMRPALQHPGCSPGPNYAPKNEFVGSALDDAWKRSVRVARARNGDFDDPGRPDKKQGKAERFTPTRAEGLDDKQIYLNKAITGPTGTGKSFGNGRAAWEKVQTPGIECERYGKTSPGPGPSVRAGGRGLSAPMGKAERFPRSTFDTDSPGPAAYSQNQHDCSNPKLLTSPAPGQCHFGVASKKPRFRQVAAMHCSPHGCWGYF
jgi:hypothetical protein